MNLDFSDGQKLLRDTARAFLEERAPLQSCRHAIDSGAGWDPELWKAVADMGWLGTALPEEFGGGGFGYLELAVIAGR